MTSRSWSELSPRVQRLVVAAGIVELALLLAAQVDLTRRRPDEVQGPKLLWRLVAFVNLFGPLAYFWRGRVRSDAAPHR